MVNIREIGRKYTQEEGKNLLEKSKQIIDDAVRKAHGIL